MHRGHEHSCVDSRVIEGCGTAPATKPTAAEDPLCSAHILVKSCVKHVQILMEWNFLWNFSSSGASESREEAVISYGQKVGLNTGSTLQRSELVFH